jgi:hypothetical protein
MRLKARWPGLLLLAFCVVAAPACGRSGPKLVPVNGVVVNGDKPVPAAMVQFSADVVGTGKEVAYDAYGNTDEKGRFSLYTTPHGDGAALGR